MPSLYIDDERALPAEFTHLAQSSAPAIMLLQNERETGRMDVTEAERVFNPGPRWRPMRMWDQMHGMPSTYIKVVAGGTQAFYVPQEEV